MGTEYADIFRPGSLSENTNYRIALNYFSELDLSMKSHRKIVNFLVNLLKVIY